jgi:hypothetical protein
MGAVFGGPIGAAIGGGVGLISELTRRSEIDSLASEMVETQEIDENIQRQMSRTDSFVREFGDPIDIRQAEEFQGMYDKYHIMAQSLDPSVREKALVQLQSLESAMSTKQSDLVGKYRTDAQAYTARRQTVGDAHKAQLQSLQEETRNKQEQFLNAYAQVNSFKDDPSNPAAQISVRQVLQGSLRDMGQDAFNVSFAPLGVGFSKTFNEKVFTYDEMMKIIGGAQRASMGMITKQLQMQEQVMKAQGYEFVNEEGVFNVYDTGNIASTFLESAPERSSGQPTTPAPAPVVEEPSASTQIGRTVGETIGAVPGQVSDFFGGVMETPTAAAGRAYQGAKTAVEAAMEDAAEGAKGVVDSTKTFLEESARREAELRAYRRKQRANRPTN